MSDPYVGEIRIFAGNYAPAGWMLCEGQILPISSYDTLFNLIGTQYGGDGQQTFALPDMRGRLPIHQGSGFVLAQSGGVENVTLTSGQYPTHTHPVYASGDAANAATPQGNLGAPTLNTVAYTQVPPPSSDVFAAAAVTTAAGGNQSHSNMQPYGCVNFIISLFGVYPSQS
ncbi:MAG: phage tail protein [Chloroflexi bacterium]|nr:phage tail protein [Chloroflexota bacterium]